MVHNGIEYGIMAAYAEGWASSTRQHRQAYARSMPKTPTRHPETTNTTSISATSPKSGARHVIASWLLTTASAP
jgi:6-phosphogluconate dehydrogenase (decarboxylating)